MAELKTRRTRASVEDFIGELDQQRESDCRALLKLMRDATGEEPAMYGTSMVGFGEYEYRYASGHSGSWFLTGFAPRKQNLTIYIMSGFSQYEELMSRLGKYKTGRTCLYIKSMADIDRATLTKLIEQSVTWMRQKYG